MQCRALHRSSVCRVCRSRKSLLCHVVSQPNSHGSAAKTPLVPPTILCDPPVSSHFSSSHRRKVHLSAVVYAPDVPEANMATSEIAFATGNENKLKEVVAILEAGHPLPFKVRRADVDLPELQGEPEDIAKEKCRLAAEQIGGAVMVEDTSLCFNAYKGLPGPYIKWFLGKVGPEGLWKMLAGFEDKTAYAQCIFVYTPGPETEPKIFVGRTPGQIVQPKGQTTFGWDPVFLPDGYDQTYAELEKKVKNTISHRYRALDQLRTYLLDLPISS